MRASVLAPAAVVLTVSAVPAQASDGPVAYLAKDTVGKNVPAGAANVLNPAVKVPATTVDGVFSAAQGSAHVHRAKGGAEEAVVALGKGLVKTAGADLAFTGISARCVTAADGTVRGVTTVVQGRLVGAAGAQASRLPRLPRVPATPPANFRVPTGDPGVIVMLNKQVRDPLGGMTVSGVSVDSAPGTGAAREFGVAQCAPVKKITGAVQPRQLTGRRQGTDLVTDLVGGLVIAVFGNPQVTSTGLPVDPSRLLVAKPALPAVPAVPAVPKVPRVPAVPAAPAVPAVVPGGLSGLLGGLPGLTGMITTAGLPALPSVPAATPALGTLPAVPALPALPAVPAMG